MKFLPVFSALLMFFGVFDSVAGTEQNLRIFVAPAYGEEYLAGAGKLYSLADNEQTGAGTFTVGGSFVIGEEPAVGVALNLSADSLQKRDNFFDSPIEYVFEQNTLNVQDHPLPVDIEGEVPFRNFSLALHEEYKFSVLAVIALCVVALTGVWGAVFFRREKKLRGERRQEMVRARQIERYQNAMIAWSEVSHENIEEAFRRATEISSRMLDVRRVSIWLYDEDRTCIKCHVMYVDGCGFSSGGVLRKKDFPRYFAAMNTGRRLVVDDARENPLTSELIDPYLLENDIYSMLDVPVFYDGTIIGVVCHEHVGGLRQWAVDEQGFSSLIASDISLSLEVDKRKAIEKSLEHQAHHDSLTGLPNRNLLLIRIEQATRRATQEGSILAVLFVDLDNFKQINDSFGHSFGDDVLVLLAQKLQGVLRESDTVARLGGDEFTFLLCGLKKTEEAAEVALKLFEVISQPLIIQGCELFVTASIGISVFPKDGGTPDVLLRNADAAMYRAKENGQNTFEFYAEYLTQRALAKVLMIADLHRALDGREFEMYYQPQYDIQSKQLVGFEALVRWRHPELGFILPEDFLSVSEESGLIVALDRWVLCEVFRQIRNWQADGFDLKRVSLNLTMQQIDQPDFMEFLIEQMENFDCKGESLGFEVTEGHLMKHPERTIGLLRKISDLGIKISIDDFGSGYSSLGYLKRFPVDTLKIDKEFILGIPEDEDDAAIVKAIIALARNMKIEVMAEGIETIEQFDFLKKEGCGSVQGYLLSQPRSASEVVHLTSYPLI